MINLRKYQSDAVSELFAYTKIHMTKSKPQSILLDAPTGSGKTVIMAGFLRKLVESTNEELSFIWLAPYKLHLQSYEHPGIVDLQHTSTITNSLFDDLTNNEIKKNEILFENWASLSGKDRIKTEKREGGKYLSKIIGRTKKQDRKIILIIDEAHKNMEAPEAAEVLKIIEPHMTFSMTATPTSTHSKFISVSVDVEEVIKQGIIKKEIQINPSWLDKNKRVAVGTPEVVSQGLKKRKELVAKYKKNKLPGKKIVNPLLLIQIPKKVSTAALPKLRNEIENECRENGITYKNKKLACWFSGDKKNLDDGTEKSEKGYQLAAGKKIEDSDNKVEVLIFKEAIGVGWDCPRAHILLLFREHKSKSFGFQVIGRIMRMPDLKHYPNENALNVGYIFTNLPPFHLERDYENFGYLKDQAGELNKKLYKLIRLSSSHRRRDRERTRLSADFYTIFTKNSKIKKKIKSLSKTATSIPYEIMKGKIKTKAFYNFLPDDEEIKLKLKTTKSVKTPEAISEVFQKQITQWCKEHDYNDGRARENVSRCLYDCIENYLGINDKQKTGRVQKIILTKKNKQIIKDCIDIGIKEFEKVHPKNIDDKPISDPNFEILRNGQEKEWTSDKYSEITTDVSKSVVRPLFENSFSEKGPEKEFYKKLNKSRNVVWWHKNGVDTSGYFGVPYKLEGVKHIFYPDFIVQWKDGTVGIYDTKGGEQTETPKTKAKAKALAAHIKKENPKRQKFKYKNKKQKLEGGIIAITAKDTTTGTWKINKDAKQPFFESKISDWDDFIRF